MRIKSVEILQLRPEDDNAIGVSWNPTVVKINTDEGLYGLGEIGLAYSDAKLGQIGIVRDFARKILGMDPFKIESIWELLYRKTFWGMGGRNPYLQRNERY